MEVFFALLLFFGPYVALIVMVRRKRSLERDLQERGSELAVALDKVETLEATLRPIEDAERHARMIVINAEDRAADIMRELETRQSELEVKIERNTASLALSEQALQAMRNNVEGYGDEYILPNHTVLDELAEEYSHKAAGERLKKTREKVRRLIKNGQAGDCDYSYEGRRYYAIMFVVDAFNGKVESVLSKVKHDNYGKLKQEILDAYALVNHNGVSFKSARILPGYLDARLEELRWAVAVHELQLKEREEQKAIRDQMREEERAQREMEKAIKEAEKEERLIQKALEKARSELASANEEQKLQYETQLAELEQKLLEAEERGQRAISMAQQTRRGHVYVISNIGSFGEHVYKIGMTRRLEPLDRVKELGDASVPFDFDVHALIYSEDAPTLEKDLHRLFEARAVNRVNSRKEFFRANLAEIRQAVENHGVDDIHWTMKAEAVEYRETMSIIKKEQALEPALA
ncbi:DUF4041 domain-containing protein [Aeromonas diversa]|uniref:DUF4041 domain-containing protein n=1 Tax=Aeromonas diversa TaxID=502790 RepID=UPI00346272E6